MRFFSYLARAPDPHGKLTLSDGTEDVKPLEKEVASNGKAAANGKGKAVSKKSKKKSKKGGDDDDFSAGSSAGEDSEFTLAPAVVSRALSVDGGFCRRRLL